MSGVDPHEVVDSLAAARAISNFFTGNRTYSNLPRKFKIAVTGCNENCARIEINDIGLWPAALGDATGFNVLAGGASRTASVWRATSISSSPRTRSSSCAAPSHSFGELGTARTGASHACATSSKSSEPRRSPRLTERLDFDPARGATSLTTGFRRDHVGVHPQRQPGLVYVGCVVPVGRLEGRDLVEAARLAVHYGDGLVRIGVDQNLTLSGVAEERVDELLAEDFVVRHSPSSGPFTRGVVACTGNEFCRYAITETKERAVRLARRLDDRLGELAPDSPLRDTPLRIHLSGCSASCAQPQVADVGLRGAVHKSERSLVEAYDVGLGGALGPEAGFIDWVEGAVPADELDAAILRTVRAYDAGRDGNESLHVLEPARPAARPSRRGGWWCHVKGYRLRDQMNSIAEPPVKTWFWELEAAVIEADRCVQCGVCVAVCPSNSIGVQELTNIPSS